MKPNPLEQKLHTALEHAAPDHFEEILARCESQKGVVLDMTAPKSKPIRFAALAAAACLAIGIAGFGGYAYAQNQSVASIVSLDVNPSIELTLNKKERVINATPLNDDAKVILAGMDLKGTSLDVAVNALVGSLLKNGYVDELANSILITVEDDDTTRAAQLQSQLTETVNTVMQSSSINGAILSQTVQKTQQLSRQAEQYQISLGKAQLIDSIIAQNPTLTFDELANKSVNDLNLLASSQSAGISSVTSIGSASDGSYIGNEAAKQAALADAGVSVDAAQFTKVEFDVEDGTMVYEVEFYANGTEYEYDIDAKAGTVLKVSKEGAGSVDAMASATQNASQGNSQPTATSAPTATTAPTATSAPTAAPSNTKVDEAGAKAIALQNAGLAENQVSGMVVKSSYDDGRLEYKVKFWTDSKEYYYEVDASTGRITETDVHNKNSSNNSTSNNNGNNGNAGTAGAITQDAALAAALNHAGVSQNSIYDLDIENELHERTPHYSVEFKANGIEYDYDIGADGSILKSQQERDD